MNSQALDRFTANEVIFGEMIDLTNKLSSGQKKSMMRLLVVSLAAFWEAFHEDLCRETLTRKPNPTKKAMNAIKNFHNPKSQNIKRLFNDVLQISDITTAWWGNPVDRTGKSPADFCKIIDHMMDIRHDTAHGKWEARLSARDCMDFLGTTVHLAIRTDEIVATVFP